MDSREEPGKQKTRSCRAQELERSRAQGKCAAEKGQERDSVKRVATAYRFYGDLVEDYQD